MYPDALHERASLPAEQRQVFRDSAFRGRILVAEDDEMLARFLGRVLCAEGFEVDCAADGVEALERLRSPLDLVLLDLNLPKLDGIGVLHQLRAEFPKLPVLVLTARNRSNGTLLALNSGADDCLTKPFSYVELLARVRALLRRSTDSVGNTSRCGDLVLQREQMQVVRAGQKIELSPREYKLLEFLMRMPGVPIARAVLMQEVWGSAIEPSTNVVDVYMKYVRDKVDLPGLPKLIRTVRGTGYMVSEG